MATSGVEGLIGVQDKTKVDDQWRVPEHRASGRRYTWPRQTGRVCTVQTRQLYAPTDSSDLLAAS